MAVGIYRSADREYRRRQWHGYAHSLSKSLEVSRYPETVSFRKSKARADHVTGDIPRLLPPVIEANHRLRCRPEADGRHNTPGIIVHPRSGCDELTDIPVHILAAYGQVDCRMIPV